MLLHLTEYVVTEPAKEHARHSSASWPRSSARDSAERRCGVDQ